MTTDNALGLEKSGGAKRFKVRSEPWEYRVTGTIKVKDRAIVGSDIHWEELK